MSRKETIERRDGVWEVEGSVPCPKGILMKVSKGGVVERIVLPENLKLVNPDGTDLKK